MNSQNIKYCWQELVYFCDRNNNISTTETVSVNPTTPAAEEKVEDIDALLNMI